MKYSEISAIIKNMKKSLNKIILLVFPLLIIPICVLFLFISGLLVLPFNSTLKLYCGLDTVIAKCSDKIVLNYGAPAGDGTSSCYTSFGLFTGLDAGWNGRIGSCDWEECQEFVDVCR